MILSGQGHYVNPEFISPRGDTTITGYVTDIITDLTINWVDKKRDKEKPFMMMYLRKAPQRAWSPSLEKFQEFSKKTFPEPASLFDDYSNSGTATKSAKMNLLNSYDYKIRPKVIKEMGEVKPGTTNDEMVQNLDFAQTLLEAAQIEVPNDMQGESLAPLLKGDIAQWNRESVYYHHYEYPGGHSVKRHSAIITKEYKLIHFYHNIDEWEQYGRIKV